jgi:hypothetical protein
MKKELINLFIRLCKNERNVPQYYDYYEEEEEMRSNFTYFYSYESKNAGFVRVSMKKSLRGKEQSQRQKTPVYRHKPHSFAKSLKVGRATPRRAFGIHNSVKKTRKTGYE